MRTRMGDKLRMVSEAEKLINTEQVGQSVCDNERIEAFLRSVWQEYCSAVSDICSIAIQFMSVIKLLDAGLSQPEIIIENRLPLTEKPATKFAGIIAY